MSITQQIRLLCTKVWPIRYYLLTLRQNDPIQVWGLHKEHTIEVLSKDSLLCQTIRAFYQAVNAYYPTEESIEEALMIIETGVAFLQAVKSWWNTIDSR